MDSLNAGPPNNLDPELFGVIARVKNAADLPSIQQQIIATAEGFATKPVDAKKLEALKEHLRYEFALRLNNSEAIAGTVARYVALRRTPETINRYYDEYAKLTPADIQKAAQEVSDRKEPDGGDSDLCREGGCKMKTITLLLLAALSIADAARLSRSRALSNCPANRRSSRCAFVFTTGAASDPADQTWAWRI